MPKFILVHKKDELDEVAELIRSLKESEIYLVAPEDAVILEDNNSKILIQEAADLGKTVNLAIYAEQSRSIDAEQSRSIDPEPLERIDDQLPPDKEKVFQDFFSRKFVIPQILKNRSNFWKILISLISLLLIVWLINSLSPLFGYIQIVITPKKDLIKFDLNISESAIPIQIFQIVKQEIKSFSASGRKELKTKASGLITVYNAYSSKEQTLIKGTRFLSKDNKIFRSTKTIDIPGAVIEEGQIIPSSIKIEVAADQIGPEYNISPTDFVIPGFQGTPKYAAFYGKSEQPIKGGANGIVTVVIKEDLSKARESLESDLRQKIEKEIKTKIPTNLFLLDGALVSKIIEEKSSEIENAIAEKFELTLKISTKALVFNENDARDLINKYLEKKLGEDQVGQKETLNINYNNIKASWDKENLTFSLHGEEVIFAKVDSEKLQTRLLGQLRDEMKNILSSWAGIDKSEITFWPIWLKRAPSRLNHIYITIKP